MHFSIIVPTYKRPQSLLRCIQSLVRQKKLPAELIVVDDAEISNKVKKSIAELCDEVGIEFVYHKKNHSFEPRGSATSRNIGVKKAVYEIVFILDDDLVLEENFCKSIMDNWIENKIENLIAIGGVISNNRVPSRLEKIYHKYTGLGDMNEWNVSDIGFQSWDDGIQFPAIGSYAHGGACSYNKNLLLKLGGFQTFQGGRTALEDVEFFLNTKKHDYVTLVTPDAKVLHEHESLGRESVFKAASKEGYNRVEIFKIHSNKNFYNQAWFASAQFFWIVRQLLLLRILYALGLILGSARAVFSLNK